ncbi:hypothetical protein GPECTOR_12g426 [Gonium pectorale]|uniref:Uncharacterized protein n=1 Tax=Gonium pectorale TaxID=33097 RepID=A0A150GNP7_GONPE|nr:hypothetical protein GPECTOR_12g426 [Gonium pectorale]|eukprot:KXZ51463.1 hypothetical protein GPECTOR_12g426 [Gonium pectorale]
MRVVSPYSPAWETPSKGSLAVTFVDELEADAPDLEGFTVHVTRQWLENHFKEITWQAFVESGCSVLGATVGIMTGLLPAEGVPVRLKGNPGRGGRSAGARAPRNGGLTAVAVRRLLPFLLLNVVAAIGMWWLPHLLRRYNRPSS